MLVSSFAFISCKSNYAAFYIENIKHAPEEFPQELQSVTLMNRSMNQQFLNHREDSLQAYFYRNGFQLSKFVLDSLAADTTLRALSNLMFESGRYDVVIPVERNFAREQSFEVVPLPISNDKVKEICNTFNTDALLVLEKFATKATADISEERIFEPGAGYKKWYYATLDLWYQAVFNLYRPDDKDFVKRFSINDTIYWESSDNSLQRVFEKLPTVKKALIDAGIKVALDLDSKISPTWIPEKRGYFLLSSQNDQGQRFMEENNFEKAAGYWEEMAKSPNKKIKSRAEFNLALMAELNGNIDKAIEMCTRSYKTLYQFQAETYLKKLNERKKVLQKFE
jgi:hypothetical protein